MTLIPLDRFEWEKNTRQVKMPPTARLVALALATYSNRRGGNIHPGNKRLADELQISLRTVERSIDWLKSHGLLEQTFTGRSAGRKGLANAYRLVMADNLPALGVEFVGSPDTGDACSEPDDDETPDTPDGSSSPVDDETTPDTDDGSSEKNTRHGEPEHPTPVTGTPDIWAGTPDTGDDPSQKYQQPCASSSESSCADSIGAGAPNLDAEWAVIKALPFNEQKRVLDEATEAVGSADWPTVVHYAADLAAGAVA